MQTGQKIGGKTFNPALLRCISKEDHPETANAALHKLNEFA